MRLPTYPQLNLPTKRLGIEAADWIWVSCAMLPGMVVKSFLLFSSLPFAAYAYFGFIKPRYPRGWLAGWREFYLTHHQFVARLEARHARERIP